MQQEQPSFGIGLRILSGILAAGMYVCVKAVSDTVPLGQIVFFRSCFALIPLVIFLWLRSEFPNGLATRRPGAHFLRSTFGALGLFASFAAIARLNVAEAILLVQLSPVLMAVAAVFLLSEKLTIWRVGGLIFGFVGVIVLVWPELTAEALNQVRLLGILFGLAAAIFTAFALILVRDLNRTESPGAIAVYFALASMIGALMTVPWGWETPSTTTLLILIAAGLLGGFGHIAMTLAFRYAQASRLAPYEQIALLWPILTDLLIFRTALSATFLVAAPIILAGAIFAAQEKKPGT